ncbi:unnamed protein product (macronuclear) [Paramecium tetraurelia]|uniref:Uncharacterized protein n=1 Tax=Paramecium tetraurelia TaxID=5888 RepID=A0ECR8_PARTE|nr:uncharacterized protein GSPATT00003954001 [Paramecium tetraurelia]CAK93085.1 unnamed protein product [Paramecium tetraurelia]|eukprot:XP_001460482.1 hypothetical protein (macronuclear) [Paramecium tetraurelia strain d4-2]
MLLKNYVNPQYYENLRRFKYSGQNLSILYNWFLGDMAQWVVDQLPTTVAPNLITITGFCNLLTSFALIFILNPMFDQDLPQWASLYIAWTIFVYQTLDNADGKQARRTKQSTALGMLMDHGSDCTATWIAGLLYINAFKIAFTPFNMLTAIGVSFLGFYFGVYCQQHTGVFQLGVINGVDEGLPTLQFFFVLTAFVSSQFWLNEIQLTSTISIQYNTFLLAITIFGCIATIIQFCYPVFKKMNWNILKIVSSLSLPITLMITFISLIYLSPTAVLSRWFHIYVLTIGLQWSKMINLWQLAIITKETFSQFSLSWAITLGSIMLNLISQFFTQDGLCYIDEVKLIFALLVFSGLSYLHCVTSIVYQLCNILDINAFSIKSP